MSNAFSEGRERLTQTRRERDSQSDALLALNARRQQTEKTLQAMRAAGETPDTNQDMRVLLEQAQELDEAIQGQTQHLGRLDSAVAGISERFAVFTASPAEQITTLSDENPFVLLPVRLETRFMKDTNGGDELWVRIFPDDIAIETHNPELTAEEIEAGEIYWNERWRAATDQERRRGAWRALVTRYGTPRAAWIVRALTPLNPDAQPSAPIAADAPLATDPVFPDVSLSPGAWARAPRVRVMPDRFVITLYQDGAIVGDPAVGRPIPDPLIVGPDPSAPAPNFEQVGTELRTDPNIAWLTDFDRAVAIGMGLRIPLTPQQARTGFDRVIALGVRFSSDENDATSRLAQLFESHHYTRGLALVPQGTPTNNTDGNSSGYARGDDEVDISDTVENGAPLFEPAANYFARKDGQILADALRLPDAVFQHVRHANGTDMLEARAMNTALFPATIGYFMETMMEPVFSLEDIRRTRAFFTALVSGRGAAPAFRVGNQPYGVLPTTSFSTMQLSQRQDTFFASMFNILKRMDATWAALSRGVTHAGSGGDVEANFLKILGLQPTSVDYFQRFVVGPDYQWNLLTLLTAGSALARERLDLLRAAGERLVAELGYTFLEKPRIFDMTFFAGHTRLTGPLIDDAPLSETQPIKPYDGTSNYVQWLLNSPMSTVRTQNFGVDGAGAARPTPTALLYLLLRHALTLETFDATFRILTAREYVDLSLRRENELLHMGKSADLTRWDYFDAVVPAVTGTMRMSDYLVSPLSIDQTEANELRELREALAVLATVPTARLERLMAEHLDLCSYRLDAWMYGFVHLRLYEMAQRTRLTDVRDFGRSGNDQPGTGIYLGAFGWLEDLRPSPAARRRVPTNEIPPGFDPPPGGPPIMPLTYQPDNAGYMHMPSLNHAAAAAILRNAYLTHADSAHRDRMTINLSSERVRRALGYFEGVRNGQPLGALLGYQFERGLHDRNATLNLDQYILPMRKKYPLATDPRRPIPADTPVEAIAARNVVDGMALIAAARSRPYPYDVPGLPAASTPEAAAIRAEADRIADSLDAVGDLALAEGVFQVVGGNFTRASAALDAVSKGGFPPEPEIVRTPRSGTLLTHRVMIAFHDTAPGGNPWSPIPLSPRAVTEPRLNAWLGTILGDPGDIRCRVDYPGAAAPVEVSLRDLNLQPLDFLYLTGQDLAGEATELENRIAFFVRRDAGLAPDVEVRLMLVERDPAWTPAVKTLFEALALVNPLRTVITGCRPLTAEDFRAPADAASTAGDRYGYQTTDLQTRVSRLVTAVGTLISALQTALTAPAAGLADLNDRLTTLRTRRAENAPESDIDAARAAVSVQAGAAQPLIAPLEDAVFAAAAFGVSSAVPVPVVANVSAVEDVVEAAARVTQVALEDMVRRTNAVLAELIKRRDAANAEIGRAAAALGAVMPDHDEAGSALIEAVRTIFGTGFRVLPFFAIKTPAQVAEGLNHRADILTGAPPLAVETWLSGAARVRQTLNAYHSARLIAETFNPSLNALPIEAVQIPYLPGDSWLALPFTPGTTLNGDKLSLIMTTPVGYSADRAQSGLLIEEWVELIPTTEETTGVAFHVNQPNSEPPQTVLVVVSPDAKGQWIWTDILNALNETLNWAKKRAVEPDRLDDTAYAQLLPAIMTAATRHSATISLDFALDTRLVRLSST